MPVTDCDYRQFQGLKAVGLTFEHLKLSNMSDKLKLTKRSLQTVPYLGIRVGRKNATG